MDCDLSCKAVKLSRLLYFSHGQSSEQEFSPVVPILLGLRHPTEKNHNLRHAVETPEQFALSFDDSLKMYF